MAKYLFRELFEPKNFDIFIETKEVNTDEGTKKIKEYFTVGPTVLTDEMNQNKRIYEGRDMDNALLVYKEKFIDSNRALGELDHPIDEAKSLYVELKSASHKFIEYRREGNYIISKAKIMDTPQGKIAKCLVDEGIKLGISTRGIGDIENRNGKQVVVNYEFVTMGDYVHDPSAPGAFLDILSEGKILLTKGFNEKQLQKMKEAEQKIDKKYKMNLSKEEKQQILEQFFIDVKKSLL
jgi:hypothetical protein